MISSDTIVLDVEDARILLNIAKFVVTSKTLSKRLDERHKRVFDDLEESICKIDRRNEDTDDIKMKLRNITVLLEQHSTEFLCL